MTVAMSGDGTPNWLREYIKSNADAFAPLEQIKIQMMAPLIETMESIRANQMQPLRDEVNAYFKTAGLDQAIWNIRPSATALATYFTKNLGDLTGLQDTIRRFQKAHAASIMTPELRASLTSISEAALRIEDAEAARQGLLNTVAASSDIDAKDARTLNDELTDDIVAQAAADPDIAPLQAVAISDLSAIQRTKVRSFLAQWAGAFGLELGVGAYAFPEQQYVGDVLLWVATFATVWAVAWITIIAPALEGESEAPQV